MRESIGSLVELETLLLLHRDASRWWSAEQIAEALTTRVECAARALETLAGRNLLDVRVGETLAYCWDPVHDCDDVVEALREVALDPLAARGLVMGSSPKVPRTLAD